MLSCSLSGCAATSLARVGCDFVEGAYENDIKDDRSPDHRSNVVSGLFNVMNGALNRDSSSSPQCA